MLSRLSCSVPAPSHAPKLHLKSISKSHAELCWDSVAVELQNGFITNYTIFWANSTAEVASESRPRALPHLSCAVQGVSSPRPCSDGSEPKGL